MVDVVSSNQWRLVMTDDHPWLPIMIGPMNLKRLALDCGKAWKTIGLGLWSLRRTTWRRHSACSKTKKQLLSSKLWSFPRLLNPATPAGACSEELTSRKPEVRSWLLVIIPTWHIGHKISSRYSKGSPIFWRNTIKHNRSQRVGVTLGYSQTIPKKSCL